jgi:large-conductance mechanosensitive channel
MGKILDLLEKNNILAFIMGALLSTRINSLVDSFIKYILSPLLNIHIDLNNNGINDSTEIINKIKGIKINIDGVKLQLGDFLLDFVKFVIIMYILFLLLQRI